MVGNPVTDLVFWIPNDQWLSSNQRLHWAAKAKRTAWLRAMAHERAVSRMRHTKPVHITAHIGYPTNGKADPANAHPTVKAIVDGLVQAGVLVEDSHEWVTGPDYRRDAKLAPKGMHTVRLEIVTLGGVLVARNSRDSVVLEPVPVSKNGSKGA